MAKKPQGIIDDIIKLGAKGTKVAINTTRANKKYAKKIDKKPTPANPRTIKKDPFGTIDNTKQGYKNQGALSYKKNIQRAANEKGVKISPSKSTLRPPASRPKIDTTRKPTEVPKEWKNFMEAKDVDKFRNKKSTNVRKRKSAIEGK